MYPLEEPHVLTADVWEAVHRATGLPIIADYYTHLYPLSKMPMKRQPLFTALCGSGDALGVRWRKDGDFIICRSVSYFWDKLQEVPNRYLRRWAQDRDASGGLPLAVVDRQRNRPAGLFKTVSFRHSYCPLTLQCAPSESTNCASKPPKSCFVGGILNCTPFVFIGTQISDLLR